MYTYSICSLIFQIPFECRMLYPASGPPDVFVEFGRIPHKTTGEDQGINFQTSPDRAVVNVEGIAIFYISSGNKIVIERVRNTSNDTIRLFLLGIALGITLHQRHYLVLHAFSFKTNNISAAIAGRMGTGKSTLGMALCQNEGYSHIGDDHCVLQMKNGVVRVLPTYPQIQLWKHSIKHLGFDINEGCRVRPDLEKYAFSTKEKFHPHPLAFQRVYFLCEWNKQEIQIKEVDGIEKCQLLIDLTYKPRFLMGMGLHQLNFTMCTQVAAAISIRKIYYPQYWPCIDEFIVKMGQDLRA